MDVLYSIVGALISVALSFGTLASSISSLSVDHGMAPQELSPPAEVRPTETLPDSQTPEPTRKIPEEQPLLSERTDFGDFLYPDSRVSARSGESISLVTPDSPDSVTDWYKNKLESRYKTRSTVKTNTNGAVRNILKASDGTRTYGIEITKNPSEDKTQIRVSIEDSADVRIEI